MSCAPLALHIQILQSNLVQSVANFHNRDLGFVAVSPLCIFGDMPSSATLSKVSELLVYETRVSSSVINSVLSLRVTLTGLFEKLKHYLRRFLSI